MNFYMTRTLSDADKKWLNLYEEKKVKIVIGSIECELKETVYVFNNRY